MTRVVIQAGHCHRRTGAVGTSSPDGYREQQFAWAVANRAVSLLRDDGHAALVIEADVPPHSYRGDAFVAVHADGNGNPSVKGASVGYRTEEGKALAHAWKTAYRSLGWGHGFRGDNYTAALSGYYGSKRAVAQGNRAACIIEAGFLTNPAESNELRSRAGQERCAQAIRQAVNAVLGVATPSQSPTEEFDMWGTDIIASYGEAGYTLDATTDKGKQHWKDVRYWTHVVYNKPVHERDAAVQWIRGLLGL